MVALVQKNNKKKQYEVDEIPGEKEKQKIEIEMQLIQKAINPSSQ